MGTTQTSSTFPGWRLHSLAVSDQAEDLALRNARLELLDATEEFNVKQRFRLQPFLAELFSQADLSVDIANAL